MKKLIVPIIACFAIITTAGAQTLKLGVKAGANLGKIDGTDFKSGFQLGYQAGAFAEIGLGKTFGIQPELLFNQTNTKVATSTSQIADVSINDEIHLNYLSIPILLRINAGKLLTFHVGPQYSILINNHETTLQNAKDAFKSGDFAAVAGLQINLSSLRIYGRYNIGLSDVGDIASKDKWKSQQIQLGLGLTIL